MGGRLGLALSQTLHREKVAAHSFSGEKSESLVGNKHSREQEVGRHGSSFSPTRWGQWHLVSAHTGTISLMGGLTVDTGSAVASGLLVPLLISTFLCVQGLPDF